MTNSYKAFSLFLLAFCLMAMQAVAQDLKVTGIVTSAADGEPLIGVNITVKGTTTGAISDFEGKYYLDVPADATLVFSYVGFANQEVEVNGRSVVDVQLIEGEALGEVVVTALGISRDKKALGYSVEQVSAEEISETGQTNLVSALQGKVPGVAIQTSSGTPGAGADIVIRGINSLDPSRSTRPLYIIDGVEMGDGADVLPISPSSGSNAVSSRTQATVSNRAIDLNIDDIASVNILKGAAATALYGIRAANGAIIITTKKGEAGKPKVNVHYSTGWENVNKTPNVQTTFIGGNRTSTAIDSYVFYNFGAKVFDGQPNPTSNIYDDFFETGHQQSYGASVSNGNDKFSYRISANQFDHKGITPFSEWGKTNFSISSGMQLTPKLNVEASVRYTKSGGNKPHVGDKSIMSTLSYVPNIADMKSYESPYYFQSNYAEGIIDHPLYLAEHDKYTDDVNRFITTVNASYKINDNISLNYIIGQDSYNDTRTRTVDKETDEGFQVKGFLVEQSLNTKKVTSNLFAKFNYRLGNDISLTALAGNYIYAEDTKWVSVRGEEFAIQNFFNLNNAKFFFQSNGFSQYRNYAFYGDVSLGYQDWLYLGVTVRNDHSSALPVANNSYFFPAFTMSWILSDMVEMPDFINLFKLRGSYATVGKDTGPYQLGKYYTKASNFPFGDVLGFTLQTTIGDVNLSPEFSKDVEVGAELSFLKNRFGIDFSYYTSNATDMILSVPVSNTTGFARYVTNAGEIKTQGIELLVDFVPVRTRNFTWNSTVNWSKNSGEVISIAEGIGEIPLYEQQGITNKYVEGGKVGDLYGYAYARTADDQLIIDGNGYPFVVYDSLKLVGNALPDWTASWYNNFTFKGLTFSMLWEWRKGGDIYDVGKRNSIRGGQLEETVRRWEQVVFNGVVEVKDTEGNVIGYEPNTKAVELTPNDFYRSSGRYNTAADVLLEESSWIRLRNVSLSYQLPKPLLDKTFIEDIRLTLTANNLYLNTPFRGYDPEINYFGAGSNIYGYTGLNTPATKSYNFTVNLTF